MKLPDNLFESPGVFPDKIDLPNKQVHFCEMDKNSYLESPFLDHRIAKSSDRSHVLDFDQLLSGFSHHQSGQIHYVFHNAFCGSTLFSRCLNAYTSALVLREPNVLMELASIVRYNGTPMMPAMEPALLEDMSGVLIGLLSRRFSGNDVVMIKPSDACNNIIEDILTMHVENKCLIMYSDIERFLTAIFKVPNRIEWVKIRANELCIDEMKATGALRINPQSLNHYQLSALVWVLHMEKFRKIVERFDSKKIQILDSEVFMNDQVGSVCNFLEFLGLTIDRELIGEGVRQVAGTHSKSGTLSYSNDKRESDYQVERKRFANDVTAGVDWANAVFGEELVSRLD